METLNRISEIFSKVTGDQQTETLELAYLLAEVSEKELFKPNFRSFNQWLSNLVEGSNKSFSKSYLYKLSVFAKGTPRVKVEDSLSKGVPLKTVINSALSSSTPKDDKEKESETIQVSFFIKKADISNFHVSLLTSAILNNCKSTNDALVTLVMSSFLEGVNKILEKDAGPIHQTLISEGRYYCASCNEIPMEPTMHHVYPKSINQSGSGPQALLCWPCHTNEVQPNWQKYAKRWLGKETHAENMATLTKSEEIPISYISGRNPVFQ